MLEAAQALQQQLQLQWQVEQTMHHTHWLAQAFQRCKLACRLQVERLHQQHQLLAALQQQQVSVLQGRASRCGLR
jgi:hypothetical protein